MPTACSWDPHRHILTVEAPAVAPLDRLELRFDAPPILLADDLQDQLFRLLYRAGISYDLKERIYSRLLEGASLAALLGALDTIPLAPAVRGMLAEALLAEVH